MQERAMRATVCSPIAERCSFTDRAHRALLHDAGVQDACMSEHLLRTLADWLSHEPVVLASVVATRGATPRKAGTRMLVSRDAIASTVAGGLAEARVIDAARALLASGRHAETIELTLDGGPQSAGICGGRMQIALRRWQGAADRARAATLAAALAAGRPVELLPQDSGAEQSQTIAPDPRLVIIGGGHCGLALYELARHLEFDLWAFDARAERFADPRWTGVSVLSGDFARLTQALDSERQLLAVLLNRDYLSDIAALAVLAERPPAFLGMMGSRRRIHDVLAALSAVQRAALAALHTPVGIDIGAETPHEIAISILAEIVGWQRGAGGKAG
jgi:xanthine dehydrogenase accessory factor